MCVPDRLLRPSQDLFDTKSVRRKCSAHIMCLPCQLHDLLGTGNSGLSRANKQLHSETALVPYKVNTFSLHNLYYLQAFLEVIGKRGRQYLKSLHFSWSLPEEDAHALGAYTTVEDAYMLVGECTSLTKLVVELDMVNMLKWCGDGYPRWIMLKYVEELPYIALVYELRGLKDIKIGWKPCEGLQGMEQCAKDLAGHWRLPRETRGEMANPDPVDTEVEVSKDGLWHGIEWRANDEAKVVDV